MVRLNFIKKNTPLELGKITLLSALLFGSFGWLIVPLPFGGLHAAFMISEITLFIASLSMFVHFLYYSRGKNIVFLTSRGDRTLSMYGFGHGRLNLMLIILFLFYISGTVLFRSFVNDFNPDYLTYPRVIFVLLSTYFLLKTGVMKLKHLINACVFFLVVFNLLEIQFFIQWGQLRQSLVATNIGIYVCTSVVAIPLLVTLLVVKHVHLYQRVATGLVLVSTIILIPFTGSRLGLFCVAIAFLLSMIVLRNLINRDKILLMISLIAVSILAIFAIYQLAPAYTKSTLIRAMMLDQLFGIQNEDFLPIQQINKKEIESIKIEEGVTLAGARMLKSKPSMQDSIESRYSSNDNHLNRFEIAQVAPASEKSQSTIDDTVGGALNSQGGKQTKLERGSDVIRERQWSIAIEIINKNPVFGDGRLLLPVTYGGNTYEQSPHNFILELLLSFGVIGAVLYILVVSSLVASVGHSMLRKYRTLIWIIFATLLFYSWFQPTLVSYLIIIWFIINIFTLSKIFSHQDTKGYLEHS